MLHSDFQQGAADPWRAVGAGDVRLTSFEGNVSMRLTAGASAEVAVPVDGKRRLYATVKIAADALGDDAACAAEASRDGGATWAPILSVGKARADAVTLWPGGQALAEGDGGLRLRLSARGKRATCWFDDVAGAGGAQTPAFGAWRASPRRRVRAQGGRSAARHCWQGTASIALSTCRPSPPPPPQRRRKRALRAAFIWRAGRWRASA